MADFNKAFNKLLSFEFSNPQNALHKNTGEDGYTFMGIYQKYYPDSIIWQKLKEYKMKINTLEKLSELLFNDKEAVNEVKRIYKTNYWDIAQLDNVKSQVIADNIFIFGVNAGIKRAIRIAQRILKIKADGIVGNITLNKINNINEDYFIKEFKYRVCYFYCKLIEKNPDKKIFLKGWLRRAIFM